MLVDKRILPSPIKVGLLDDSHILIKLVGKVILNRVLVLHNVLLVEGFKHNLMSIGQLIDKSGIQVTFTTHGCCFQDLYIKKL